MPEIKNMKEAQTSEDMVSAKTAATLAQTAGMAEAANNANGHKGDAAKNGHKGRNGHLTSGRLLARNTVWNLVGSGAPMLVAVFCIPILIRGLGTDRFGVLTLAWALVGYDNLAVLGMLLEQQQW